MPPARPRTLPFLQLLPNLVTILGLCAGLTALRLAFAGRFEPAVALIVLAALIDGVDGLLARRLNAASPFGAELDTLSDFLNFGVAPALIVYRMALAGSDIAWTAALVFSVCACLRLARFNVNRDAPGARPGRISSGCRPPPARSSACSRPTSASPASPTPPAFPGSSRPGSPRSAC